MNEYNSYYPIQLPFLLNEKFKRNVRYEEITWPEFEDFAICFWEMTPKTTPNQTVENIIVPDACIDLLVDDGSQSIGFAGMKKTEFHYPIQADSNSFGFRLKPGAFYCLTRLSAELAMDDFLPLAQVDTAFSEQAFFKLSPEVRRNAFFDYYRRLQSEKPPSTFMVLFDKLFFSTPNTVREICEITGYSQKQCQRLFMQNFGLTPKMVISTLRFQNALNILVSDKAKQSDILRIEGYYDQPHMIKDLKQSLGLTPLELLRACQQDDDFIQ
jgi:AraC-like DNA-binding protein